MKGVSQHILGVKGDECQCGRRASVRHCPSCGSTRMYARMARNHRCLDGSMKFVENEYRCMNCGHLYIEEERQFCEAPPVGMQLAQQKAKAVHEASQTGEYLNREDKTLASAMGKLVDANIDRKTLQVKKFSLDQLKALDNQLVIEYTVYGAKRKKQGLKTSPEDIMKFYEDALQGVELSQEDAQTILTWRRKDLESNQPVVEDEINIDNAVEEISLEEKRSIDEQTLRTEWAKKKLLGEAPTETADEFVALHLPKE